MKQIMHALKSGINPTALTLIIVLLLSGCLAAEYGFMRRDIALTDAFEANNLSPDYDYYISGSKTMPDAILGLKKGYALQAGYWKTVSLTEEQLTQWTELIGHYTQPSGQPPYYAYNIYGPDNEHIGVWYGYTDQTSIIKTGAGAYKIYTPPQSSLKGIHWNFINRGFRLSPE